MKKLASVVLLSVCLFSLCSCAFLGLTPSKKSLKERASKHLGLSLENTTVLEEWDTHGGFHGDGETFVKLSCADGFEENLHFWKRGPLRG